MAASTLPIPHPPRTPSPLSDDPDHGTTGVGLGLGGNENTRPAIETHYDYDRLSDSPDKPPDSGRTESTMLSPAFSSVNGLSPNPSPYTPITPQTANTTDGSFPVPLNQSNKNPFNFTTTQYTAPRSGSIGKSDALGKRRGHKYKHSSIHTHAMDSIFQPPAMKTPLAVPASLPIPTRKETWRSLTPNQTARLTWCLAHFTIATYVQFSSSGSLAMTALSRLLLFDAAGATVCVVVDVMSNFEVWKRSSIKHPFGLERADVLAGFGMAVFISFMGLDIISHGIEHSLENVGAHEPHHGHGHERVPAGSVDIASLLAITSTLISAIVLKNHTRIGRATNIALISRWGKILGNPSHVLTLASSTLLLILPLLSIRTYTLFDLIFSFAIAGLMITLGVRLGTSLASMLLMSYKPPQNKHAVRDVIKDIEMDEAVSGLDEASFWQVHYGLCMANLKVRCHGSEASDSEMGRLRKKITSLIRQRLGGRWEVSLQMVVERD